METGKIIIYPGRDKVFKLELDKLAAYDISKRNKELIVLFQYCFRIIFLVVVVKI